MDSKFDFGGGTSAQTVYIRQVAAATLPRDVQDQLPGVQTLYAVHDRALAFTLARENELRPVSVH